MKIGTGKIRNHHATVVSDEFIDNYMAGANGEYVKVYLYLLRHANEDITYDNIAGDLELTHGDVSRAIDYWTEAGLLGDAAGEDVEPVHENKPGRKPADMMKDKVFSDMLWIIQQYLNRPMTEAELESAIYMYDQLKFSPEMIEYLVEVCVQKGKTSFKYMETIARSWHQKGISTVKEAKADTEIYSSEIGCVMKTFGLNDRKPGEEELKYINKWFRNYGMSKEIVTEALNRTLAAIQKPSFRYADSIIGNWYKAGVTSIKDIEELDRKHEEKARKTQGSGTYSSYGKYADSRDLNSERISAGTRVNAIKREYDEQLRKDREELDARVAEVYRKIPRIAALDEMIGKQSVALAKLSISNGPEADEKAEELMRMKEEKAMKLKEAGFPEDYLQMHYVCNDCKDTGFIDGRKCHCFIQKEALFL